MAISQILLCFVFHILLLFSLSLETTTSERREGRALVKWKNTLGSDTDDDVLHSWSIANLDNICTNWTGIGCNYGGAVYKIELDNFGLSGTLESLDFNSFPNLTHFNLHYNSFVGSIPNAIVNLTQLVFLDLSWNLFEKSIPIKIGRLTKLQLLNLGENNLVGTIPIQISHLNHLTSLYLNGNYLTGPILESLLSNHTKLSQLVFLDLSWNLFEGFIPAGIGRLTKLELLNLGVNYFTGIIPSQISQLQHLTSLSLNKNIFTEGRFPEELFSNMTKLQTFSCGWNLFHGPFPTSLIKLSKLKLLDLSENYFYGSIPPTIENLTLLEEFSVLGTLLQGNIPTTLCTLRSLEGLDLSESSFSGVIPRCLGNLTLLRYLYLDFNMLHGNIPKTLCNLQNSLELLFLSNNSLGGAIPQCLGEMKFLTTLDVSKNHLRGMITPPTLKLCGLSSLKVLDLSDNNLHGPLPLCLENFSKELVFINLARNQFQGTIPGACTKRNNLLYFNLNGNHLEGIFPPGLVNCTSLQVLDLGNNNLSDSFPHWIDTLPDLRALVLRSNHFFGEIYPSDTTFPFPKLHILDISHNKFTGPLPRHYVENLGAMQHGNDSEILDYYDRSISLVWKGEERQVLQYNISTNLDLSNNFFHGEIPKSLGRLHLIRFLNLSHNQLTGDIPSSLGNLTLLEVLDLSSNQLVGEIPGQLAKSLTFLAVLNLSYNYLSGPIPHGAQFDTFSNNSYLGNTALCGFPLTLQCQIRGEGQAPNADSQHFGIGWQSVVVGYFCGIPFGIVIGHLIFKYGKLRWLVKLILGD
ncbi:PREDICTED: receptor-like protein 12 [Ipomoea nil]|uniref:receptor-like protein 12 n=1 Tax=Ipomoea nil TaxID=35883 RepID=UPI000901467D|nr:PREDICTED: receptor-like protein 12 [Ipomoea nil]